MKVEYPAPRMQPQLRKLWKLVFGDSEEFLTGFFSTAYSPDRCRCIREEGQIVAALYWLDCGFDGEKLAYIYAVATHPDFRGGGLCRRLMEDTHAVLAERGYAGAFLMPAEPGLRQMYGKMGYQECGRVSEFTCSAGQALTVRPIGKAEYAALRRRFLPAGGVLQEGVSLDFLETYGQFYCGESFLLAASADGEQLRGLELLGDRAAAPGILATLGYDRGWFRTPGTDIPFAMFRPLKTAERVPSYLGFSFD